MRNGMPVLKLFFPWAFNLIFGIFWLVGGVATLDIEPWMPLVLLPVGAISALIGVVAGLSPIRVLFGGRSDIDGSVTAKAATEEVTDNPGLVEYPNIQVGGNLFVVSHSIYNWVEEGDEVVVTFWQRNRGVVSVVKTGQPSLPEEEPSEENQRLLNPDSPDEINSQNSITIMPPQNLFKMGIYA